MKRKILGTMVALILFAAFMWVGKMDSDAASDDHRFYCEMIQIYKNSNGQLGWPDDGRKCPPTK